MALRLPQHFAVFNDTQETEIKNAAFLIIRRSVDPPIDEWWGRDLNHHTTSSFRQGLYPRYIELSTKQADELMVHWRQSWHSDHIALYAERDLALSQRHVMYYAQLDRGRSRENPSGVLRRVQLELGRTLDQEFDAKMSWWPTEFFRMYARGHMDVDHVEITIEEGEGVVNRWIENGHRL